MWPRIWPEFAKLPKEAALPSPADRQVAKELDIRREFDVLEVVDVLEAQSQIGLIEREEIETTSFIEKDGDAMLNETIVAPVAQKL